MGEVEQEGERLERLGELVALHQPTVARRLKFYGRYILVAIIVPIPYNSMGAGLQSIGLLPLWQQILYGTC